MPNAFVVVLIVAFIATVFAAAVSLERRRLGQLASAFGPNATVTGLLPSRLSARFEEFVVEYRVVKHHSRHRHHAFHPSHAYGQSVLVVRARGGPTWTAAPEGLGTSLLKGLGVMSDIQLGIEDLDRALRFTAKAPRRLPDMLVRPAAQEALRTLAGLPRFAGLRCAESRIEARYSIDPHDVDAEYDQDELLRRLKALIALAQATGARPAPLAG